MPPAGLPIEQVLGEYSLSFLRKYVALFVSTRARDSFRDRRRVPPIYFLTLPNIKRQPYHTTPIQMISNSDTYRPFEAEY